MNSEKKSRVENFLTLSFSEVTLDSLLVHTQFVMSDFFMDFVGFPELRRAKRKFKRAPVMLFDRAT